MRRIDHIFIHCSASPEGREDTAGDIAEWHVKQGWNGIGYHFVIELDGKIVPGRDPRTQGAGVYGHNRHSLHICYVGGMSADMSEPKDTLTPRQLDALVSLLETLSGYHPDAKVLGHRDAPAAKACPSLSVLGILKPNRLEWMADPRCT